jgi:hypothetical protein
MGAIRVIRRVRTSIAAVVVVETVNVTRSGKVDWPVTMTEPEHVPAGTTVGFAVSATAMHVLPLMLVQRKPLSHPVSPTEMTSLTCLGNVHVPGTSEE